MIHQVVQRLSSDLQTKVSIEEVQLRPFSKLELKGFLLQDQQRDTLLYAGSLLVSLNDWFFLKNQIILHQISLTDAVVQLHRTDSVWNYTFLTDYFSGSSGSTKNQLEIKLEKIDLGNIHVTEKDGWRGEDREYQVKELSLTAEVVDLPNKTIHIQQLRLLEPYFGITEYTGQRPDSLRPKQQPFQGINDPEHLRWNPDRWKITIDELTLNEGRFRTIDRDRPVPYTFFDGFNIDFRHITAKITSAKLDQDSITARIVLQTRERSGLEVQQLSTRIHFFPEAMEFDQLDLKTPFSHLQDHFAMRFSSFDDLDHFNSKVLLEGLFDQAVLHSNDLAYFAPALKNWNLPIRIKGKIRGSVSDLQARNLEITAGNSTYLKGTARITDLPDWEKAYVEFDAHDFRTTYPDAVLLIPALKNTKDIHLEALQFARFKGMFTGFFQNFVTEGILETNLGTVLSDFNLKIGTADRFSYYSNLTTKNFHLGKLLDVPELSTFSFSGSLKGNGMQNGDRTLNMDGNVQSITYKNYTYQNLVINGQLSRQLFEGSLTSKDPHLNFQLNGLVDFSHDIPEFNLQAEVNALHGKEIHISEENIDFSGKLAFDFTGNQPDNFNGRALIYEATLKHDGLRIPFDSLTLVSNNHNGTKMITVLSNEFDAALVGEFSVNQLPQTLKGYLNHYFPNIIAAPAHKPENEKFDFVITTKNIQDYIHVFSDKWKGFNYSTLEGRINSKENLIDLSVNIPQFSYQHITAYDLALKGQGNLDQISVSAQIDNISWKDSLHFPFTSIALHAANDTTQVEISTSANQAINTAQLKGTVITRQQGVNIIFGKSYFEVNGKKWTLQENGELILTRDLVAAEGLQLLSGQQEILAKTIPSELTNANDIEITLREINIGDFTPYLVPSNRLEGILSGKISLSDVLGKLQGSFAGKVQTFRLDNDSIGELSLTAEYLPKKGLIGFTALSTNKDFDLLAKGQYILPDSGREEMLDLTLNSTHTKIDWLHQYLSDVFTNVTGYAQGVFRITGPPKNLRYLGKVNLLDGQVRVGYTQVTYRIPKAEFEFLDDRIDLGTFTLQDTLGNSGTLTRGILRHRSFRNMNFDFALQTPKLLAYHTTDQTKDAYYGKIIAKASVTLTGPLDDLTMNIKAQPADTSQFFIRSQNSRQSGKADYIVWKTYGKELSAPFEARAGKLTLNMDLTANPLVQTNVIFDELTNDVMSAVGHGNLKIRATTSGEFEITGQVDIEKGNYNFTFQSLLRKPFKLTGESGSYLRWNGNPYNADMKVTAEYKSDNVKFSDLGDQLYLQTGGDVSYIKKFRGEVRVIAYLTGELMRPDIKFKLEMPESSPLRNDPLVVNLLHRIETDPNELNKQVAFLIIFNSFGPLSTSSQANLRNQAWEGLVSNSISGFISNQLSKQFSSIFRKVFNDESIKVNFNAQLYNGAYLLNTVSTTGFGLDRTSLNLSLAKSMFEERLTFTFGSAFDFGLTSQQARATNNLQFLPDFTAEWKLRPDGKLLLTCFYRDSYNYQSVTGKQNRSGAGISFRRDFEKIGELWRSERKNKKPKNPPAKEMAPGAATTKN